MFNISIKGTGFAILAFSLNSCSALHKKTRGIKNPQIETVQTLNKYAQTLGIDTTQLVFTKDTTAYKIMNSLFQGNPEILIFDKSKTFYPYKEDSGVYNASINLTLENICSINYKDIPTKRVISYDVLLSCISDPNDCLSPSDLVKNDYVVFFNFAKYFSKINKDHLIVWAKFIRANKIRCAVKYVFIDFDCLNTWGLSKKSLKKLTINVRPFIINEI